MTYKFKLLSLLLLSSVLAACGGGGGSSDGGSSGSSSSSSSSSSSGGDDCGFLGCEEEAPVTQLDITNETLPLQEQFTTGSTENSAAHFFSSDYKPLNSTTPQTVTDADGNEITIEDPNPSFYYATCCLWAEDPETGETLDQPIEDLDQRQYVGDGFMVVSSARFSIGQLQPDLVSAEDSEGGDAKTDTTNAPVGSSWGELDLSQPYRVSFCLNDNGPAGTGFPNLELYVDNNSGGNQDHSIHAAASLLLRTGLIALPKGNRVVVDVPGNAYMMDNSGNQVGDTLAVIAPLDGDSMPVGTEHSFLQFRISSGGYGVITDLVVQHQDQEVTYQQCAAWDADDHGFEPTALEGIAFAGLPLDVNFDQTWDEFFGDEVAGFLAFADENTKPFYQVASSGSRILLEEGSMRFGNAYWTIGWRGVNETTADDTLDDLDGGLDLSEDFRVTLEIESLTNLADHAEAQFQVSVDNSESSSAKSHWGEASKIFDMDQADLEVGTLVINVPGDITMNDVVIGTVDAHIGSAKSFLMFRCPGNCGNAEEGNDYGIILSDILVEKQDVAPAYLAEDFGAADAATFFSEAYRSVDSDSSIPMYAVTAGAEGITVADGALAMANARFTIGSMDNSADTAAETQPNGSLDLSKPYRVRLSVKEFTSADDTDPGKFQIYVDNNTTSSSKSIHGGDSKIVEYTPDEAPTEVVIVPQDADGNPLGTATSFLQIRADSRVGTLVIDDLVIEYVE